MEKCVESCAPCDGNCACGAQGGETVQATATATDALSQLTYELWAPFDRALTLTPSSATLLFVPPTRAVSVTRSPPPVPPFTAQPGVLVPPFTAQPGVCHTPTRSTDSPVLSPAPTHMFSKNPLCALFVKLLGWSRTLGWYMAGVLVHGAVTPPLAGVRVTLTAPEREVRQRPLSVHPQPLRYTSPKDGTHPASYAEQPSSVAALPHTQAMEAVAQSAF